MFELVMNHVVTILIEIIVIAYFSYLLRFRLGNKWFLPVPVIAMTIMSIVLSSIISSFGLKGMVINFIANSVTLFIGLLFFKDLTRGLLYALIMEVLILLSDGIAYYTVSMITQADNTVVLSDPINLILGLSLNIFLLCGLSLFFGKRLKSIQQMDIPKSYWGLLLMIPACSIWIIYTLYGLYQESQVMLIEVSSSLLLLLGMIFGSTVIYEKIADYFNEKLKNHALSSQIEVLGEKQNNQAVLHRETMNVEHDLKNKLLPVLYSLNNKEFLDAREAVSQILGDLNDIHNISDIGIECIDDMINYKAAIARKDDITFHVDNNIENRPDIPFMDISAAIGIALDNAIEACQKEGANKDIYIDFICKSGIFITRIENDLVEELRTDKHGVYLTAKPDSDKHGFGIKSIQTILDRHNGELHIEVKGGKFILIIICDSTV